MKKIIVICSIFLLLFMSCDTLFRDANGIFDPENFTPNEENTETPTTNTYTITFNANGGSGTMESQVFTKGVADALSANTFTRTGYTFVGWSTTANGAIEYVDTAQYTAIADAILYAIWTDKPTYTITFDANGGEGLMPNPAFVQDIPQALPLNMFTKEDHVFIGWSTTVDNSVEYENGANFTSNKNTTLYAIWVSFTSLPGVYLDGTKADNGNGEKATPFNNFESAKAALTNGGTIWISGTVTITGEQTWSSDNGKPLIVKRAGGDTISDETDDFKSALITVKTGAENRLTLQNIILDGQGGINGNEGAIQAEKSLIHVEQDASLTITNGAFLQNNKKTNYGGVYGGGVYVDGGNFTMTSGIITNNTAHSSNSISRGGGVYVEGGNFTLDGGSIINNTSTADRNSAYGGGVHIEDGVFAINDGSITSNTSSGYFSASTNSYGGGVYLADSDGSNHTMNGGSISGNIASFRGGGVYIATTGDASFTMNNGSINTNNGRGIYIESTAAINFTMNNGSINGNSDGGVYFTGKGSGDTSFTMENGSINGNRGGVTIEYSSDGDGNASVTMNGGEIRNNFSSFNGGGVSVSSRKTSSFIMNDGTISNNSSVHSSYKGGGVYVYGGESASFTINKGSINDNISNSGGAVYVISGGSSSFTMENGLIQNNKSYANGGGIYIEGSSNASFTMNNGIISMNSTTTSNAESNGGGVYIKSSNGDATFTMLKGDISTNSAFSTSNRYSANGGGVYAISSNGDTTFIIDEGKISSNDTTSSYHSNGGGVYASSNNDVIFTIEQGSISNNTAMIFYSSQIYSPPSANGGGVYVDGGFTLKSGTISDNTLTSSSSSSSVNGGGVYVNGNFTLEDGTISSNTATSGSHYSRGGGVYIVNGSLFMSGGSIIKNSADVGGGIWLHDSGGATPSELNFEGNVIITDNTSGEQKNNIEFTNSNTDSPVNITEELGTNTRIGLSPSSIDDGDFLVTSSDASLLALHNFLMDDGLTPIGLDGSNLKVQKPVYSVGDTGPGGGTVFYADASGAYKEVVMLSPTDTLSTAVNSAESYNKNTKDDWYLPNKHELNEIYEARDKNSTLESNIADNTYWSTTSANYITNSLYIAPFPNKSSKFDSSTTHVWTQDIATGDEKRTSVNDTHAVLAIRCYNPVAYTIGETGPGGGKIFWVDNTGTAYKEYKTSINYGGYTWEEAMTWANNYTSGSTDWYLLDVYELKTIYNEKENIGLGSSITPKWSSTEVDGTTAWLINFVNGMQATYNKSENLETFAIRSFNTGSY